MTLRCLLLSALELAKLAAALPWVVFLFGVAILYLMLVWFRQQVLDID